MGNRATLKPKPFTSENQPPKGSNSRKGCPNRATVFARLLKIKIKVSDPRDITKKLIVSLHEAAALGIIQAAMKGNPKAFEIIQDSLYGKIVDKTEIDLQGGGLSLDIQAAIAEVYGLEGVES